MIFKWFSRALHTIVFVVFITILTHFLAPMMAEATPLTNVFINEIHYDNISGDENEFIELAGISSIDLSGWSLHFYNGGNGNRYKTYDLSTWLFNDVGNGFGIAAGYISGIQNGSPDGIVLADADENVIQFLSYEGSFMAKSGIAKGLTSINIGVNEPSTTLKGYSIQLKGQGNYYDDFEWSSAQEHTFDLTNNEQLFFLDNDKALQVSEPLTINLLMIMLFGLLFLKLIKAGSIKNKILQLYIL